VCAETSHIFGNNSEPLTNRYSSVKSLNQLGHGNFKFILSIDWI
jgi:hypothetical protein